MMTIENVLYYLFVAGMFFVMMRFGCGSHVMGHGHRHADPVGGAPQPADSDTDPVCGMSVKTATAKTSAYLGRVYYFCSQDCREKFEAAPATFAKTAPAATGRKEQHHGC